MRLQSILDMLSPLPFWVNHGGECERFTERKSCDIDGEITYITVDGDGELTIEIKEDENE